MKAMSKQQLAQRAGVSVRTLGNWLRPYLKELEQLGQTPHMKVLTPPLVKWIVEKFCIEVDDD